MAQRRVSESTINLMREAEAISVGAGSLFLALSFVSYAPELPKANLGGLVGHIAAGTLLNALGLAAYVLPAYLAWVTYLLARRETDELVAARFGGAGLCVGTLAAFAGLAVGGGASPHAGGWLGGFIATALRDFVGVPGAALVFAVLLLLALVLVTGISASELLERSVGRAFNATAALVRERWRTVDFRALLWRRGSTGGPEGPKLPKARRGVRGPIDLDDPIDDEGGEPRPANRSSGRERLTGDDRPPPIIREPERKPEAKRERTKPLEQQEELFADDPYKLPTLSLLDDPEKPAFPIDEQALLASSRILEAKLADFGVAGKVVAVRPGPVITTFEFEPAPGVKVNRIVSLADDLLMALRALSVRVLAPIPGKPVVGIEVSNPRREKVFIKDVLGSEDFRRTESTITLGIGKDTTGNISVADLAKMPHLLIAGATGTGKSVSMNAMILSMLYKATPRDVRFIMIDPKMLELSVYEDIPHLLVPVVTDPKKASAALNNIVREMDDRYRLLHEKGVRNVDSYNRLIAEGAAAAAVAVPDLDEDPDAVEIDEPVTEVPNGAITRPLQHRHLARIVVIIDELADLMMTSGREVEESITRLAQKARAAGIHLILATQRPSVDVITGLIKANFPARISFQVTSGTNSRTILDTVGAERLLGEGDLLYLPPGTARVKRHHGAFVSDAEVHRVVDFIKKQEQPRYEMALLEGGEDEELGDGDDPDLSDEMYDMAVRLVTEHRQASISWVQRRLRVGYNRAARMIERMEREGVVSAATGARGREVLARRIDDDES